MCVCMYMLYVYVSVHMCVCESVGVCVFLYMLYVYVPVYVSVYAYTYYVCHQVSLHELRFERVRWLPVEGASAGASAGAGGGWWSSLVAVANEEMRTRIQEKVFFIDLSFFLT